MSEKEIKVLEALGKVIPTMTDEQKMRMLGYAEGMADKQQEIDKMKAEAKTEAD